MAATRRPTRQRTAVSSLLEQRDDFVSAQMLHADLRANGDSIGLATVYRTLQTMWADGDVDMLRTADGEAMYRRCTSGNHHHHIICRQCNYTVEIEGPAVERWTHSVASQHGFRQVSHQVEIFGLCDRCADGAADESCSLHTAPPEASFPSSGTRDTRSAPPSGTTDVTTARP